MGTNRPDSRFDRPRYGVAFRNSTWGAWRKLLLPPASGRMHRIEPQGPPRGYEKSTEQRLSLRLGPVFKFRLMDDRLAITVDFLAKLRKAN